MINRSMQTVTINGLSARGGSVSLETDLLSNSLNAFIEVWYLGAYDNLDPGLDGVIIDAGANVGDFTLKASKWVGDRGIVVAVEPVPRFLSLLKRNLSRNRISNVIVVDKAIGDGNTTIGIEGGEAETVMMDELLDELGISRVDSVKLDIEGAELLAIEGGTNMVRRAKHFSVETHSDELRQKVARILGSEGYRVYRPSMPSLVKKMGIRLLNNPRPFVVTETGRIRSWDLTKGPFSWNIARWLCQRKKPDWFSPQSGLALLAADRSRTFRSSDELGESGAMLSARLPQNP